MSLVIIDYGMGNLKSVANALEAISQSAQLTADPKDVETATGIILPGVGAFGDGMRNLRAAGFVEPLKEAVLGRRVPFLGICLGMQFLAEGSDEGGQHEGLGWMPGHVRRITPAEAGFKVPHMGWHTVEVVRSGRLFEGLPEAPTFYFVHSYHFDVAPAQRSAVTSQCWHGQQLVASVEQGNIFGVQFHPEKSQAVGLHLLTQFAAAVRQYAEKAPDSCLDPAGRTGRPEHRL